MGRVVVAGVVELPLGLPVGDSEGPALELVVGRALGWSDEVTLGGAVGA